MPNADAMSVTECAMVNAVTTTSSGRSLPERNHQAQQEQQVIRAVEDVPEPLLHEEEERLVPPRIEPHDARVAMHVEHALGRMGREKPHRDVHADAQARQPRLDGKVGFVRRDRVLERDVEHALFPVDLGVGRQARAGQDVVAGRLVVLERPIRRQRDAGGPDRRLGQPDVVLVDLDEVANPQGRGMFEGRVDPREVQEPVAGERDVYVPHGLKGRPHQEREGLALRFQVGEDGDFVRDLVGLGAGHDGHQDGHEQSQQAQ